MQSSCIFILSISVFFNVFFSLYTLDTILYIDICRGTIELSFSQLWLSVYSIQHFLSELYFIYSELLLHCFTDKI